ncbi:MAG: type II toxin-antitoxin system RelE/ParE family toxin [Oceanospirillales bacterium]|nr:MAG: type II toxin-antitoxin system RelE/ParE family toxin [Oceanospirillales bacterium]
MIGLKVSTLNTLSLTNLKLGEQLFQFKDREVRKIHIGSYEMRYEIQKETIFILRVWHTREER